MSESVQIAPVELKEWLQKETAPLIRPLKDKRKKLFNGVKKRLDDVKENGDRIFNKSEKEIQKSSPKTYRCAKAASKMSRNITGIIDKVVVSDDISYEDSRSLLEDLGKAFEAIEHERRVWYRRISPYFILDRRRLDITIKRAEDSIQELRSFLFQEYVKIKNAEDTLDMADKLRQLLEEAEHVQKQKTPIETRINLLEERIQKKKTKVASIHDKAELDQVSKLEQRIGDLKAKARYNLRHLQKPFYKMQSLARRAQIALPPDEARKLEQYMKNPFEALTYEDEGHPILKRILQKLDDAIRQGKLKLKTARLRKARQQMDSILKRSSLVNLHHDGLEAISRRKQLLTSQTVTTIQSEMKQLQATLQNLQRQNEVTKSRRRILEEERQRTLKRIEIQKRELEKSILELTDKKVQVVLTKRS